MLQYLCIFAKQMAYAPQTRLKTVKCFIGL